MQHSRFHILFVSFLTCQYESSLSFLIKPQHLHHRRRHARNHRSNNRNILRAGGTLGNGCNDENVFETMKDMDQKLAELERQAPDTLAGFYEPHLYCFSVRPGTPRFSITSTLFALETLSSTSSDLFDSVANMDMMAPLGKGGDMDNGTNIIPVKDVVQATIISEWKEEDLFQVPLLIHMILQVDTQRSLLSPKAVNEETADRLRRLISALLSSRPLRRKGQSQALSDYLIFLCARAMATLNGTSTEFKIPELERNLSDGAECEDFIGLGGLPAKVRSYLSSHLLSIFVYY